MRKTAAFDHYILISVRIWVGGGFTSLKATMRTSALVLVPTFVVQTPPTARWEKHFFDLIKDKQKWVHSCEVKGFWYMIYMQIRLNFNSNTWWWKYYAALLFMLVRNTSWPLDDLLKLFKDYDVYIVVCMCTACVCLKLYMIFDLLHEMALHSVGLKH